jgi:streptogramin lyase
MMGVMRRLITGLAVAGAVVATAVPAARADVTPEYFTLPAASQGLTGGLAVAPDGTVYFGGGNGFVQNPPIGRLIQTQAVPGTSNGMTFVETPDTPGCCSAQFREMTWSTKDNALYWTRSDNLVGRLVGDTVQTAPVPAAPWGIAASPLGGAWLAENYSSNVGPDYVGDRIAYVSPALDLVESNSLAMQNGPWDGSRYDARPKGIAVAADGTPWFSEAEAGNPGYRLGRGVGKGYNEWRMCPTSVLCSGVLSGEALTDVTIAPDGAVWYTNEVKKTIGRFDPSSATYAEFALSSMAPGLDAGKPILLTTANDGSLWLAVQGSYSAPGANAVVRIVPSNPPGSTVYKLGGELSPTALATDANGNVWFSGTSSTSVGRLGRLPFGPPLGPAAQSPPPATTTTPPPVVTPLKPVTVATAKVTDPTVRGDAVNANQICVGPPEDKCSLVYLIQTHEYVKGFPNTNGYAAKATLTTIGKATVTLKGGQKKKITIKLNSKGKKLLKKIKKFKATLTVTQSRNGAKPKQILKKNLKFKK